MVDMAASEVFLVAISRADFARRSHLSAAIGFREGFVATPRDAIFSAAPLSAARVVIRPLDARSENQRGDDALRHPGLSCGRRDLVLDAREGRRGRGKGHRGSGSPPGKRAFFGPAARLDETRKARTLRGPGAGVVLDGPFAETKEQLLGFHLVEYDTEEAAIAAARTLRQVNPSAVYEIRPVKLYVPADGFGATPSGE
ncbi:hypothetical protein ACVWZL_004280 [Bradyrhizobium sp. GM2.4]